MKANKYILALSAFTLVLSSCRQDHPEMAVAESEASRYYIIDLPVSSPDIIDLETGAELKALPSVSTNGRGYPVIKLPATLPASNGQQTISLRWRLIDRTNPETQLEVNGITAEDGKPAENTGYRTESGTPITTMKSEVITSGDRQVVRLFLPYGNKGGWWGTTAQNRDIYAYLTYGLQVASPQLGPNRYERVKHYYGAGLVYDASNNSYQQLNLWGRASGTPNADVANLPRNIYLATEGTPHNQMIFPMSTPLTKGILKTRLQHTQGNATNDNVYTYLAMEEASLKPRGTIMALNFKNETGQAITIQAIEARNNAFAFDGYFGAGAQAYTASTHESNADGYAPEAVMTGAEVKGGAALKFVETNKRGFSQYTLNHRNAGTIPTSQEFNLHTSTTVAGITASVGAVTSGRFFVWGYPKGNGTTAWTVRVKYVHQGETTVRTSRAQLVNPPVGGRFQEGTAYLATIRVKP